MKFKIFMTVFMSVAFLADARVKPKQNTNQGSPKSEPLSISKKDITGFYYAVKKLNDDWENYNSSSDSACNFGEVGYAVEALSALADSIKAIENAAKKDFTKSEENHVISPCLRKAKNKDEVISCLEDTTGNMIRAINQVANSQKEIVDAIVNLSKKLYLSSKLKPIKVVKASSKISLAKGFEIYNVIDALAKIAQKFERTDCQFNQEIYMNLVVASIKIDTHTDIYKILQSWFDKHSSSK